MHLWRQLVYGDKKNGIISTREGDGEGKIEW